MSKIVVIGSSNVDFVMKMERLPQRGETVGDAEFVQTFGGKGANQAVGAAKAGGNVWFLSCVGDDALGPQVKGNLVASGVHVDYVYEQEDVATGAALIMVGSAGANYISVAPGANYRLTPAILDALQSVIAEADMIVLQYEIMTETVARAIELGSAAGKPVIFNLAPARPLDEKLLKGIAYLIVNETEAALLCGFPVTDEASYDRAAAVLLNRGVGTVILTLGEQGAYVAAPSLREWVPAFPVEPVDTTAAGDVFCGALAVALVEGKALPDAVRFANAAAAICVTRLGAQPSAPDRAEIDALLNG